MVFGLFLNLLHQLGLMRSAVGLLALCALVSMVGTLIPQGLPLQDYVAVFGPVGALVLWHSGLTDVFGAWWFLAVLAVMLTSVAVCLFRNGPLIYRHIFVPEKVPGEAHRVLWEPKEPPLLPVLDLRALGFKHVAVVEGYDVWQRGVLNRVGYFFVHIGILGIATAGLLTGLTGWRGTLNLREGETDNVALVWRGSRATPHFLPFTVTNQKFEIERYPSGMPRRYVTTLRFEGSGRAGGMGLLALHWGNGNLVGKVMRVEVNRPVAYGAYRFYQAGFGDGGSLVRGLGLSLQDGRNVPFEGRIYDRTMLPDGTRIELLEFRPVTVEALPGRSVADVGPSLDYLVQPPDAPARQLRAFLNHPDVVGVAEGEKTVAGVATVIYRPVLLGIKDVQLWPLAARVARGEDYKSVVAPVLRQIPDEQARVTAGLAVMQASRQLGDLGLTHLMVLRGFELYRYSGLQVTYDPAAPLFWVSALVLVLGVMLMMGRRLVRVWVKDGRVWLSSPHGLKVARNEVAQWRKDQA